ncbi:TenA family protein [Brevibacterium sp. BRM-1]|uniref:TenA family protein n=1 Tax=Brevibacterium sp. BRM-1 TaxID=2999062 RepID=UPI0022820898|nr:TenA family protein [Brevibacterium sp. BRM-1]WAL40140.1 TenA family protein [Brevibacterium sp. BRM-1]
MIDRNHYAAGEHTAALFASVGAQLDEIEALPFLAELASGTLDRLPFAHYLLQDELYLDGYARAMSLLAARAPHREDTRFWALAAGEAIAVETQMHEAMLTDESFADARGQLREHGHLDADGGPIASPTTLGYTSFLIATCATAPYAVGAAAVLPCFWIYAHVGKVLNERAAAGLSANPFRVWIETYDSAEFDESVRTATQLVERELAGASAGERAAMHTAFGRAAVYELHFWASAHALQDWSADRFV